MTKGCARAFSRASTRAREGLQYRPPQFGAADVSRLERDVSREVHYPPAWQLSVLATTTALCERRLAETVKRRPVESAKGERNTAFCWWMISRERESSRARAAFSSRNVGAIYMPPTLNSILANKSAPVRGPPYRSRAPSPSPTLPSRSLWVSLWGGFWRYAVWKSRQVHF